MAVKENVKVEEILDGEEFTTENENGGEEMTKKNINWKLYGKCVTEVLLDYEIGRASCRERV